VEAEEDAVVDVFVFDAVVVAVFVVVVEVFDVVLVVFDVVFEVDVPTDDAVAGATVDDEPVVAPAELIVGGTPPHALAKANNPRHKIRTALLRKSEPRTKTPFSHTCALYRSTRPNRWCRANAAAATDC
jgi:hypothetical protein